MLITLFRSKLDFAVSVFVRCSHSEKKYGLPSLCEHCNKKCAFDKPEDVKRKV